MVNLFCKMQGRCSFSTSQQWKNFLHKASASHDLFFPFTLQLTPVPNSKLQLSDHMPSMLPIDNKMKPAVVLCYFHPWNLKELSFEIRMPQNTEIKRNEWRNDEWMKDGVIQEVWETIRQRKLTSGSFSEIIPFGWGRPPKIEQSQFKTGISFPVILDPLTQYKHLIGILKSFITSHFVIKGNCVPCHVQTLQL